MFKKDGDVLITALPNADNNLAGLYNKRYYVNRARNRFELIPTNINQLQVMLNQHKQEAN
jgi:hypothetical protein